MKPLLHNEGKGKELRELLEKELGIPKMAKWFTVRFAVNVPVEVAMEYYPSAEATETVTEFR